MEQLTLEALKSECDAMGYTYHLINVPAILMEKLDNTDVREQLYTLAVNSGYLWGYCDAVGHPPDDVIRCAVLYDDDTMEYIRTVMVSVGLDKIVRPGNEAVNATGKKDVTDYVARRLDEKYKR